MINIYGPQESAAKSSLWNRLAEFMNQHNGEFILFGDFNTVLHEYERSGSLFSRIEVEHFNAFIDSIGLIDLPIGRRRLTWMNKAGTKLSKLDHFLISEGVMEDIPDIKVTAIEQMALMISLSLRGILWKRAMVVLRNLKNAIKKWQVDVRKIDKSHKSANLFEIHDIEKKIDDGSASIFDHEKRIKLLQDIDKHENLKALDLIQKARIKWDIESGEIRNFLESHISLDEVKNVVWECGSNKAPGPDGFSFAFIKKYWDLMKMDIFEFVWRHTLLFSFWNTS
uniref:RNA-directed DNA polymerase, eukaryota n=1 Tax=Tanacetum cinerariifolium TaxID=118510 RepID=A0A6L2J182_TANCI|nr:RNA-directed DNA polymerase, eukaryota [Tanacetum cinerariifolium]